MKLLIDISDDEYRTLKEYGAWNSGLIECIKNGTPLDGTTNGEVLQLLFPKIELGEKLYNTRRYFLMSQPIEAFDFKTTDRWWNTPYQKGGV